MSGLRRFSGLLAGLACLGLFAPGCRTQAPGPSAGGGENAAKLRLAVIPKGSTHEFWKTVHAGAAEGAKNAGVEIVWKGPIKEDDRESQIKTVEDFVAQRVDGIALAPLDDTALRLPVIEAQEAGIPVLVFDSGLKHDDIVSFVATDNRRGGKLGGEALAAAMGGSGKAILLRYQEGSASTTEREEGFLEAMKEARIEVLAANRYGGATVETAQAEAENLIARFRKPGGGFEAAGVFCPNESTTFGMLTALRSAGLAGKVKLVGFDASAKLVEGLGSGEIEGLVVQDPYNMGKLAVETLAAKLRGEPVEARVDTGATLVTRANMAEHRRLLDPPQL
jgi:ribose transport system substrate-binding protein